jgi:protein-tyrosine-phosphatase
MDRSGPSASLERLLAGLARRGEPSLERLLALAPIRRRLHRRALSAWRASEEPLIVCAGNINRSPFAAALARRRPASRARSAGLYPLAGRPSPPASVAAAAARGVALGEHRSTPLRRSDAAGAQAIFIFDLENLARLAVRAPRAVRRTHFLGALAAAGGVLILDPHGREPAVLERVFAEIDRAIDEADRGR